MKKVIISGATSMLGIATIKECLKNNVFVTAISRKESRRKLNLPDSPLINYVECDLNNLKSFELPDKDYDVFFHFGWAYTDKSTRDDPQLQSLNIGYTLDAVQLAHRCGCRKFIGAGSQAEYGFQEGVLSENSLVKPGVCYGYSKYAAGKLAEKLCANLDMLCIWTRIFSIYGKNDSSNTLVSYAIHCWEKGEVARFSSGCQMWNYLYEDDAGRYFYLLGKKCEVSTIVNIASDATQPLKYYIESMAEALDEIDSNKRFQYVLADENESQSKGICPTIEKLIKITGYYPQIAFKDGIQEIVKN